MAEVAGKVNERGRGLAGARGGYTIPSALGVALTGA